MKIVFGILIVLIVFHCWLIIELKKSPIVEKREDGSYKIIRPSRTTIELFKKKRNDRIF